MMINRTHRAIVTSILLFTSTMQIAKAQDNALYIKSTELAEQIALVPFLGHQQISTIVTDDLNATKLKTTSKNLPARATTKQDVLNNLNLWQQANIPYAVVGSANGNRIDYEVINTQSGTSIGGQQTEMLNQTNTRQTAHKIADNIYQLITGKQGDFSGKIAFIEETGTGVNKVSRLKIMDIDGKNMQTIDQVTGAIFTPTWHPNGVDIAYAKLHKDSKPVIYMMNINSQTAKLVTPFNGTNLNPSFSPNGNKMLFSYSNNANADIYQLSAPFHNKQKPKQITNRPSDEAQPSYSPDGHSFVFVSDRNGSNNPRVYRFNLKNRTDQQISPSSGYASNPSYSPDGSKIAFLSGTNAVIMRTNGQIISNLGNTGVDGAPSFSPNSSRVVYAVKHGSNSSINIKSLEGGKSYSISTQGKVLSPVWSNNRHRKNK